MISRAANLVFVIAVLALCAGAQGLSEWKKFSPESEEFSVEFPALPKQSDQNGTPRRSTYWADDERTRIFIASDPLSSPTTVDQCLRVLGKFQSADIDLGSLKAKKFTKTDADFQYSAIAVSTEVRAYLFFIVAPAGNAEKPDRFLSSIRIEPKPKSSETTVETTVRAETDPSTATVWPVAKTPAERRFPDNASLPVDPMARPETDTAGLRILSSPRPGYNDVARLFMIEGEISVRVTFNADGTIGSVTTLSKLPFGLTESAIGAARSIKFVPARRDKKPYAVSKMIVYSFTLY